MLIANVDRLWYTKYSCICHAMLRQILRPSANLMNTVDHRHERVIQAYCNSSNRSMNLVEMISERKVKSKHQFELNANVQMWNFDLNHSYANTLTCYVAIASS